MANPTILRWRGIQNWPTGWQPPPTKHETKGRSFDEARRRTTLELTRLGVTEAYVETDHLPGTASRLDGFPKSDAQPQTHRAQIVFEIGDKVRVMRCHRYSHGNLGYSTNLYLLALTLERMRLIQSYGTMSVDEQFGGFAAALPEGPSEGLSTPVDAIQFLRKVAGLSTTPDPAGLLLDPEAIRAIYRQAAGKSHPDRSGGSQALISKVNAAKALIDRSVPCP